MNEFYMGTYPLHSPGSVPLLLFFVLASDRERKRAPARSRSHYSYSLHSTCALCVLSTHLIFFLLRFSRFYFVL